MNDVNPVDAEVLADAVAQAAEAEANRASLLDQLTKGVANLQTVRATAANDIAAAASQRDGALNLKTAATTQKTQVAAFTPPATYQAATITSIRDALVSVLARQELILQALADLAAYRKANDESTVITDDSLLWLARLVSGRITD